MLIIGVVGWGFGFRVSGRCHAQKGINANDGFGGGDEIAHNLVFSSCRESGDRKEDMYGHVESITSPP